MYDGGFGFGPGGGDGGYDWNGNGYNDSVDDYMDYKVGSGSSNSSGGSGGYKQTGNKPAQGPSWGVIGKLWLVVLMIFLGLFIALTLLEELPLICCVFCIGVLVLAIRMLFGIK